MAKTEKPRTRKGKNKAKSGKDFEDLQSPGGAKIVLKKGSKYEDDAQYNARYMAKYTANNKSESDTKKVWKNPKFAKGATADWAVNDAVRGKAADIGGNRWAMSNSMVLKKPDSMGRQDRPVVKQKKGDASFFKHTTKGK